MRTIALFVPIMTALLVPACAGDAGLAPPEAEDPTLQLFHAADAVRYEVVHLSTLGGTESRANAINNRGWAAGYSHRPGDGVRRATLWRDGEVLDLGSLGAETSNSNVPWAGLTDDGMVVGITETAEADSLDQAWSCASFVPLGTPTGRRCVAFAWDRGEMMELPSLGGSNGFAAGVNNRGQVVGWAETSVHDPTCTSPQVRQFRAVLWEPRKGRVQELSPWPGDSASAATAINKAGRVVGISGDCDMAVGRHSARHAVVWDNGSVSRLPTLSGDTWNTPMAINDRGDIVGFALSTDPPGLRAVFWSRHGGITDLGTLGNDPSSQAHGINGRGQVVGVSHGGEAGSRAFIWRQGWRDGALIDLNDLVVPGYTGVLRDARDISDSGVITGSAEDAEGNILTFVATPVPRPGNGPD